MSNKFFDFINLHYGEEQNEKVLKTVKSNISFRGSNFWILACAIVIASVGLNINSTAVVIGAMLISPLMGPIVGTGFALAIYDFDLFKKSVRNLLVATMVSLFVATVYFFVSPFKESQSELLSRTSPSIYDVLIAFLGGIVGAIAVTRVVKGNPIPGVAIATALMPPLCTAGYGLSIGNFSFFFGALYLYSINCFFIFISTYLIIKFLKYRPVSDLHPRGKKLLQYGISILIFLMIIPSFYLAYNMFREKEFNQKVEQFITEEFSDKGYALIYKNINYKTSPKKIELAFLTKKFTPQESESLNKKLLKYDITNTQLTIRQNTKDINNEILNELVKRNNIISDNYFLIDSLQKELNEYKINDTEIIKEIAILFPELKNVTIGKHISNANTDSTKMITVLTYHTDQKYPLSQLRKLNQWLSQKLQTKDLKLIKQ